ncbi:flagellar basal body rod modification protein [Massilia forsythiae]|uniref:Basal-body rod modification protein FlgD n=1 Tax=Massilia forsythiae TaxID=2728020 RepID=A0A7Z2VTM0_9BURK|nr:flagellar hook capping FlgD N-terminal domain-containing protein [Massilia forsythiae]QJD99041.1 flagellar basal body rod modification protein [Massilia forsythiae]
MVTTTSTSNSLAGNATTTGGNAVAAQATTSENRDMFTKLLVAQIQNQDPLQPQDPTTYVNQLSQLSQTEALQNLSQMTTANASVLQSLQTLAMGGQVGSDVTVNTGTLQLGDEKVSGNVQLLGASSATDLVLTGSDGRQHTVALGAHGSGSLPFTLDPSALGLAPGTYAIQAKPADGSAPQIEVSARLNSVRVTNAGVVLQVANVGDVATSSITAFNGKTGA